MEADRPEVPEGCYERFTLVIDRFSDGSCEVKQTTELFRPPCQDLGAGCRMAYVGQVGCGFDPKTGLCEGGMP